jgi:hypothetical protein
MVSAAVASVPREVLTFYKKTYHTRLRWKKRGIKKGAGLSPTTREVERRRS